jgi:hypothetical protein
LLIFVQRATVDVDLRQLQDIFLVIRLVRGPISFHRADIPRP